MDLNLKHSKKHNYNNVPPENPFNDEVEKQHFYSILAAFKYYKTAALSRVERREQFVDTLPGRHQARLLRYRRALQEMRSAIHHNHQLICLLVEGAQSIFENVPSQELLLQHLPGESGAPVPKPHDIEKVHYVLKQVVRDWSAAGALERLQCYSPVIQQIQQEFPDPSGVSVLVPGAGLGRLAYEIAVLGYICQGNEFSFFMIFASNFVLNKCHEINQYSVHPWAHQLVNNLTCEEQLRNVSFPDISPAALQGQEFSMVAGDFVEVYTKEAEWDCVATCFFIDCAPNVIDFIETIYHILKPGGIWVNIGPLLYHFCDTDTEGSIEPPFDILCDIIKDVGFSLEKSLTGVKTKYFHNPSSMLQHEYDSVFLVCRKPFAPTHPHTHSDTHTDTDTDL